VQAIGQLKDFVRRLLLILNQRDTELSAAINNYGNFVDRGDPASYDFTTGSFTTNGVWHDLDLSSIVPAGAKAVLLHVYFYDTAAGSTLAVRKNGNSNNISASYFITQVPNISVEFEAICPLDDGRIIEYYGTNKTFSSINFGVKGWFT
jgi:hypothetical protein